MKRGNFLFISDSFYEKYDEKGFLMKNKEGIHNRPCFYAFADKKNSQIIWCVPISSQTEKFEKIVQKKIQKQQLKGIKNPKCNTIRFGFVMGKPKAFLIQNMFPVAETYITDIYIDRNTHKPVSIKPELEKDIIKNAREVQKLVFRGYDKLVFADIQNIYKELSYDLNKEKKRKQIEADIKKNGFNPSEKLVLNIEKLNRQMGRNYNLQDIHEMYRSQSELSSNVKDVLQIIADECKQQEMEQIKLQQEPCD